MGIGRTGFRGNEGVILHIRCRFDYRMDPELADTVKEEVSAGRKRIVLDLTDCPLIDSAGLHSLVASYLIAAGRGGKLVIAGPNRRIEQALESTKIRAVIETYKTTQEAIEGVAPEA